MVRRCSSSSQLSSESLFISEDLEIQVCDSFLHPCKDVLKKIHDFWEKKQAEKGSKILFNDWVLCCFEDQLQREDLFKKDAKIQGFFLEYRDIFAQRYLKDLFERDVFTLAISGLCRSKHGLLLGRRSGKVQRNRGSLELVPSGALSRQAIEGGVVSLSKQFEIELQEEAWIAPQAIKRFKLHMLYVDYKERCADFCVLAELGGVDLTLQEKSEEYEELFWLPIHEVKGFLSEHRFEMVGVSTKILESL